MCFLLTEDDAGGPILHRSFHSRVWIARALGAGSLERSSGGGAAPDVPVRATLRRGPPTHTLPEATGDSAWLATATFPHLAHTAFFSFSRDAITKMKDVYLKNPQMGDPASLDHKLAEVNQNIEKLRLEAQKFEVGEWSWGQRGSPFLPWDRGHWGRRGVAPECPLPGTSCYNDVLSDGCC